MTAGDVVAELDARFSAPDAMATSWTDVHALLDSAEVFWISTVRRDGRLHVTPLTAVWRGHAIYFCTGAGEQKGVNLQNNPRCTLTTGSNEWKSGLDVVIEGVAERVTDEGLLEVLARGWESKYHGDWHYEVRDHAFQHQGGKALVFEVAPVKILAFAKGDFAQTRFTFLSDT